MLTSVNHRLLQKNKNWEELKRRSMRKWFKKGQFIHKNIIVRSRLYAMECNNLSKHNKRGKNQDAK